METKGKKLLKWRELEIYEGINEEIIKTQMGNDALESK